MSDWVSLHHHTTYSYQDGYGNPEEHLQRAAELGYDAMAFTEHGNVSSHFRAEKAAAKVGIKPIFGLEAYTGPVGDERKQIKYHLILLAMNAVGYRNLNLIVTQSWRDFHYYPTVSGKTLANHSEGLICLSGCTGSLLACTMVGGKDIPTPINGGKAFEDAMALASKFKNTFGDRYFLECQGFPELEKTRLINPLYARMSRELDIPLVATMDVHYPYPDDNEMQVIIHAADRGGKTVDQQSQTWEYDVRLTLPESANALYTKMRATGLGRADAINAVSTAKMIADNCNVTLPKAEPFVYPVSEADWEVWDERR